MIPIKELRTRCETGGWALLPIRLMVGFGFAAHGYAKLARGPNSFAAILAALGVPVPLPTAWATSLLEFAGGVLLMLGVFVLPLVVPLVVVMLVAMISVHFPYGFSSVRLKEITPGGAVFGPVGYEVNLLYIAGLLGLALGGATPLSLRRLFGGRTKHPPP